MPAGTRSGYDVNMKWRRFIVLGVLVFVLALSTSARTASADDTDITHDARVDGYRPPTGLINPSSEYTTWVLFLFIGIVGVSALFKDAKRTHLD